MLILSQRKPPYILWWKFYYIRKEQGDSKLPTPQSEREVGVSPGLSKDSFYFLTFNTFCMLKKITGVDKSKAERIYATDIKGNPMFGRTPGINELMKPGLYANVEKQRQT